MRSNQRLTPLKHGWSSITIFYPCAGSRPGCLREYAIMCTVPSDFAGAARHLLGHASFDAMSSAGLGLNEMCGEIARRGLLAELRCDDPHRSLHDLAIIQNYARRLWRPGAGASSG
ncbi:hypothetical protein [Rugamonas aquatica]|uniref:Uncharacterized protein n=1 Tax=Rugamonas aquatica TaxID=2743357 RepID=A0A6A7N6G2_9BURK|nr:hypothetical protein [Rugamonas aquatica]MQA40640.1 hypothetical protein [Rugamonas aquatica]